VATRDDPSRGLVYGDAPHDLVVGINGNMNMALYNKNISYDTQLLENGSLSLDEVEVLYLKGMTSYGC
jgi:hypothetical protein